MDMLNAVKSVLADVSSVSPSSLKTIETSAALQLVNPYELRRSTVHCRNMIRQCFDITSHIYRTRTDLYKLIHAGALCA